MKLPRRQHVQNVYLVKLYLGIGFGRSLLTNGENGLHRLSHLSILSNNQTQILNANTNVLPLEIDKLTLSK